MEIYAITAEKNICKELKINLQDTEWEYDYIDHDGNMIILTMMGISREHMKTAEEYYNVKR